MNTFSNRFHGSGSHEVTKSPIISLPSESAVTTPLEPWSVPTEQVAGLSRPNLGQRSDTRGDRVSFWSYNRESYRKGRSRGAVQYRSCFRWTLDRNTPRYLAYLRSVVSSTVQIVPPAGILNLLSFSHYSTSAGQPAPLSGCPIFWHDDVVIPGSGSFHRFRG